MFKIGEKTTLKVDRIQSPGAFLVDEDDNDVLLPNKYLTESIEIGDNIDVFIYLDGEERIVATTETPFIELNDFAVLTATSITKYGAFMDWGLEKELLIPFREQKNKIEKGKEYLVYMYFDKQTERLVGSTNLYTHLQNNTHNFKERDQVDLIIWNKTDLGYNVIINKSYLGLIYINEVFKELQSGDRTTGFIKKIREDGKIDASLEKISYKNIEPNAKMIIDLLEKSNKFISLNDKSSPEDIKDKLSISKKAFKKSIGLLYKKRIIRIEENGISLI